MITKSLFFFYLSQTSIHLFFGLLLLLFQTTYMFTTWSITLTTLTSSLLKTYSKYLNLFHRILSIIRKIPILRPVSSFLFLYFLIATLSPFINHYILISATLIFCFIFHSLFEIVNTKTMWKIIFNTYQIRIVMW